MSKAKPRAARSSARHDTKIVATLSRQLVVDDGCGFEGKSLRRMVPLAELFADDEDVASKVEERA